MGGGATTGASACVSYNNYITSPQDCSRCPPTSRRNCLQGDWNGLPHAEDLGWVSHARLSVWCPSLSPCKHESRRGSALHRGPPVGGDAAKAEFHHHHIYIYMCVCILSRCDPN